jgi:hypothetical protein
MGRPKKVDVETSQAIEVTAEGTLVEEKTPTIHDTGWTDFVLSHLEDDEKIKGNPTTDGLRRIFEVVMNCDLVASDSEVDQSPCPQNEKRATVTHTLSFKLKDCTDPDTAFRSVTGSADVYWGNCDKIYRNHPVAVAETRAEGRALRRALRLRKVIAAEEVVEHIEDNVDGTNATKINNTQLNFIDVLAKRLDININKLLDQLAIKRANAYNIEHSDAVSVLQVLTEYQASNNVPAELIGYDANWK